MKTTRMKHTVAALVLLLGLVNGFSVLHRSVVLAKPALKWKETGFTGFSSPDNSILRPTALFSKKDGSVSKTTKTKKLAQAVMAAVLAYGYLHYYLYVTIATFGYYLFQHVARNRNFKNGEWVTFGGMMVALALVKRILTPARFLVSMLINFFVMYFVVNLANGDLKAKDV